MRRNQALSRTTRRVWSWILSLSMLISLVCLPLARPAQAVSTVWTSRTAGTTSNLQGAGYANGIWMAVGTTGWLTKSTDGGATWAASQPSATAHPTYVSVLYTGGNWVIAGYSGTILTSPDTVTWTTQTSNTTQNMWGLATNGSRLVAVGANGTVISSTDNGVTWSSPSTAGTQLLDRVTYGGGQFVAVGSGGTIYTSPDGVTWNSQLSGTTNALYGVTYGNGLYMAVGASGTVLTSTDGVAWTSRSHGGTNYSVTFAGGLFVMVEAGGVIEDSADGVSWAAETSNETNNLYGVAAGNNTLVAVGQSGALTTRAAASSNANLSNLTLSAGTLNPAFNTNTTSYTASVPYTTTSIGVTPTLADGTATMRINGTAYGSGSTANLPLAVGANTITVVVTAEDTTTTKTYSVTVARAAASTNANLSNLTISAGTLTPAFAAGTTAYTATVANGVTSVNVTPTVADSTASVTVNGAAVASGSPKTVSLNVGYNTIYVVVTAQDGTTQKTYTLTITRLSSNANLSNLTLSSGTLSPAFAAGTTSYTASVAYTVTNVDVTPYLADTLSSLQVNGSPATNALPKNVSLSVGANPITVLVTAQDGTTKTYTVTVTRAAPSTNSSLSNLSISQGTLSPAFASGTTTYTANVPYVTASLNVTPTVADGTATLTVNGSAATSGAAVPVALSVGANTITVLVTAQDGSTTTYTVTVTRAPASTNSSLSNLTISQGALSPAFAAGTTAYTATVANGVASVNVTPTAADGTATLTVNGSAAVSGNAVNVPLSVGANTITVVVTAEDGVTQTTYTVVVTRLSNNANLSNLTLSQGTLSPAFAAGTTSYTASVLYAVTSVDLTPTLADGTATLQVNGSAAVSGNAVNVPLTVGANTITVLVTAQDGTTKTYTVTVTRAPASTNANLSSLTLSAGTLTPAFAAGTTSYTATVANSVTSVDVTPTLADGTAALTVNTNASASGTAVTVPLTVGANTITVQVTAEDGTTVKTYTVVVTRLSNNAHLSDLTLSSGTLTPAFDANTISYTASVANSETSVDVTPTLADSTATLKVNGNAATSGAAANVALNVGANTITVLAAAQDGTTKTYTVTVTRLSNNADMSSLALSPGALSPAFAAGTTSYTASFLYAVSSVQVTPTLADSTATQTVNGSAATSGAAVTVPLGVGANTITVLVTAQDGTTKTYTITVTRAPASTNADLSNLTLSSGTLSPAFAAGTFAYTATVANSVTSLDVTPTLADSTATLKVNGSASASGTPVTVPLSVGANTITVLVTAEDGSTQQTYTVVVTRLSNNANLSSLTISQGTLTPAFAAGTTSYTASVLYAVTSVDVTPVRADSTASLQVNGNLATSGAAVTVPLNVGVNTVTVLVTAQDGTTKTYTLTVTRQPASTNANLSGLTLSSGTLTPAFAAGTVSYTATVANSVTSVDVTPTLADTTAALTLNGNAATSGAAVPVNLNVGANTITLHVAAEDGTTQKTYTVVVTRLSNNANLSDLSLSSGTLTPAFDANTTGYTAIVANAVASVDVTPTLADSTATLKVNGNAATSGAAATVALNVGTNTITVLVTAQDGTTKTYTVTVTRLSNNADLSGLAVSPGALSPAFDANTTSYTVSFLYAVASVDVTPTVADSTATLKVNGNTATSGAAVTVPLNVGSNTITLLVTAQDGTPKTYTITVTRALASTNADLSNLTLSSGTLSPAFDTGTFAYTARVANSVTSLNLTPTLADTTATMLVNGSASASGTPVTLPLSVGANTITVQVTAEDLTTVNTYTVVVTRLSNNADLSSLAISQGTLTPAFAAGITSYTASVLYAVASVDVTPVRADSTATLTLNGNSATSGAAVTVPLNVGANTITVLVTAQDGTTKTYTVTVTRAPASTNANLSSLTLSAGTLTPAFAAGTTSYTASVLYAVTGVDVTPTVADGTATLQVNGNSATSGAAVTVPLSVGANPVTMLVTAQDGTTKTYTVTVTRAPASANASLSNLTLSSGTLTPVFAAGTFAYTATVANGVTSLDVTPTLADTTAKMTVNGSLSPSGTPVTLPLNVGANTITVHLTAEDGITQTTYMVTVLRPSNNADLSSLTVSQGTFTPAFDAGITGYSVNLLYAVTGLNVTATLADGTATMTVNGSAATSGTAVPVTLNVGANPITVLVTAQDGTTKTYTVTVTRAPASTNANLSALTLSAGTLTPAFAAGTASYTARVVKSVTSIDVTPTVADGTATLQVNGNSATSGTAVTVPLTVGANTITVQVTAEDLTTVKTYTVVVTRMSDNANLSSLTLSTGTLSPAFASGTTGYSASVAHTVTTVNVTPALADSTATLTVNGTPAAGGSAVPIAVDPTAKSTVTLLVTSEDGTQTMTYTVDIWPAPAFTTATANVTQTTSTGAGLVPLAATGVTGETLTFTLNTGSALPAGITLNADGTFTGTATTAGSSTAAIKVADTHGGEATTTLVITVLQGPVFTAAPTNTHQSILVGGSLTALAATADPGQTITFAKVSGDLPAGITLNADGTFSGTATASGTFTATIEAADGRGGRATTTLQTVVSIPAPPPPIPTISVNGGVVTTATPAITGTTSLPDGTAISVSVEGAVYQATAGGGVWSATVTAPLSVGNHTVTAQSSGSGTPVTGTGTITVKVAPTVAPIPDQNSKIGDRINLTVTATGAAGSHFAYTAAGLPPNLTIDSATGVISGNTVKEGIYTVTVTVTETVAGGVTPVSFTWRVLKPNAGTVSGTVTDADTGKPVSGATVTLSQGKTESATTDSAGGYSFASVSSLRTFALSVTHPNYVAQSTGPIEVKPGEAVTQDFQLRPVGTLRITSPTDGARVSTPPVVSGTFAGNGPVSMTINGQPAGGGMAGADGTWRVDLAAVAEILQVGPNTVSATATDKGMAQSAAPVTFLYSPRGKLAGTVRSDAGAPLHGIALTLLDAAGHAVASATTGADGTYTMSDIPVGTYTLRGSSAAAQVIVIENAMVHQDLLISGKLSLTLSVGPTSLVGDGMAAGTVAVTVTTADGQPAAGISVQLTASAGGLSAGAVTTDSDGRAQVTLTAPKLAGISPRTGLVTARVHDAASGASAEASVAVQFVPASITGTVVDNNTGKPVAGAKVSVAEDFDGDGVVEFAAETVTGTDGTYILYVPRGNWSYKTHVTAPIQVGGSTVTVDSVHESQVGDVTGVGQQFTADRALTGQLLVSPGAGQAPLRPDQAFTHGERISVVLRRPDTGEAQELPVSPNGAYGAGNLNPGQYQLVIQVTAPDGQKLAGTVVTASVSEQGELSLQTALIDPYGIVTDAATGKPVPGVQMMLMWADTSLNRSKGRTPDTGVALPALPDFAPNQNAMPQVTTAGGEYAWMVFPQGDYYIVATKDGYLTYDSRQEGRNVPGTDSYVQNGVIHVGETIVSYSFQMTSSTTPANRHTSYIHGYPDGTFGPNREITRAEVATVLARLLGPAPGAGPAASFTDVSAGHWAAQSIATVAARGIMVGDPDGRFRPEDPVSRAEVAVIVSRMRSLAPAAASFPDVAGHWAAPYIAAAKNAGILSGYPDGTFQPERSTSRAEFVTIMNRTLKRGPLVGVTSPTFPDVPLDSWASGQVEEAATDHTFEVRGDGKEYLIP